MAIERAALPISILPNPLIVGSSLYATLEEAGLRPVRALQKISAINLGPKDAELLQVEPGRAGLKLSARLICQTGALLNSQSLFIAETLTIL